MQSPIPLPSRTVETWPTLSSLQRIFRRPIGGLRQSRPDEASVSVFLAAVSSYPSHVTTIALLIGVVVLLLLPIPVDFR